MKMFQANNANYDFIWMILQQQPIQIVRNSRILLHYLRDCLFMPIKR